ncbi:BTB/POZ and MATH domain-containing protein 1 [Zea mays]|uniref:TRAF transcription factor n=1 Tax=Zea mays TaxID=4577 RepID=K7TUR7_MAIZE|eukprot:XP_008677963.1 BTB/POZ and MATH domain-containing protein 1 [Zea mays]
MESEHHLFEIAAARLERSSAFLDEDYCSWSPCIQGYHWRCVCSADPAAGTASFTVSLPYSSTREPLNASFKLSLLDRGGLPVPSRTRATLFQNCLIQQMWQWECPGFLTRDDLERHEYYLDSDGGRCFRVRCDIAIKPFAAATAGDGDAFVAAPPSDDLHRHLGDLLARKDGADVTFQLVDAGGETFSAHRCVLAARSPVFRAQLFGEMMESSKGTGVVIPVEDMEAQVFSALLAFIYTDSLPPETGSGDDDDDDDDEAMVQYQLLLAAADRYGVDRMKLVCQEKLCKHIRADSVATMLVLADRHHCPALKEACFRFLSSSGNLGSFTQTTDGFEVLNASCPAVLKELLAKLATVLIF